jgi:predicted branched-subunit amino acid permease
MVFVIWGLTMLADFVVTAMVVGIVFFVFFGHEIKVAFGLKAFFALLCTMAAFNIYDLPALRSLDIIIEITNEQVADFLGAHGRARLNYIIGVEWLSFVKWLFQSILGYFTGKVVYRKIIARNMRAEKTA